MHPTLRNPFSFSAALSAAVAAVLLGAPGNRVHAASVDGATVSISGTANTGGLFGQIYNLTPIQIIGAEPAISTTIAANTNFTAAGFPILESALNQAAAAGSGYTNVNFNNGTFGNAAPFAAAPYSVATTDNITARWSGYINLPAGVSTFATNSDDGSVLYIDGVRVVNNNQLQGNVRRIGQTVSFASAGAHEIVIAYYEAAGGAGMEARYAPGVATTNATDPAFVIIPVVDGGSAQVLTGVQNSVLTPADGALTFSTASTIGGVDFTNALQVNMGALTFAGTNTLNYKGAAARFTSTTFNGGGTNVIAVSAGSTFSQDIALGQLADGGVATRLQKTGPGQLVLDQTTNANTMGNTSVIEIRGGGLVLAGTNAGQNPIGSAAIELGSTLPSPAPAGVTVPPSTLSLTSKAGNVVFDNPVSVLASNTIVAQQVATPGGNLTLTQGSSVGVPTPAATVANATVTLGSATNAVSVASGQTVTFQTNNGYTLDLAGGVTGAGNVAFAPGNYILSRQLSHTGTLSSSTAGASLFSYNVNNALGNKNLAINGTASQITIAAGITNLGGDGFTIGAGNVLILPTPAVGAQLTRGTNFFAAPSAVIAESTPGANNAIQALGTNGDLLFGLAANLADNFTVGIIPGATPWRGISTDRAARTLNSGSTITAQSSFQITNLNNVALTTQAITIATPNGPVAASVSMGTSRWLPSSAAPGINSNVTFTLNVGTIQLVAANSLGSSATASANARIVAYSGTTLDPNGTVNTMSGNIYLRMGSFLQLNDANNLGGIGAITGDPGALVQLQQVSALANANAAQNLATLPAGVVYRLEVDLGASLETWSNPAGIYQLQNGNRTNTLTLNAGTPARSGVLSGVLTNDNVARTLSGAVTIGANGGTLAASPGGAFTIAAPITVSTGGGRALTVGTTRLVDVASTNDVRSGSVVLSATTNSWGTGADALAQLTLVGRSTLQNAVAAGVTALPQGPSLAVSLGGIYQVNGGSGAGTSTLQLGQITPQGGTILLNRNATTPDTLVLQLNAPISRSNTFGPGGRGTIAFQTAAGQVLGTSEKVQFVNAADAPARISGASAPINMVAPWMVGSDSVAATAISTFLDVDPATATTTGFVPVTYVAMPLTGGTGNEIADNITAATLTAPISVAALRTNSNISGQTITLSTGGLLFRGSAAVVTISSAIAFGANEGIVTNISGQANIITGLLSGTGGFTKHGANSLVLNNAGSTLTGGITINEFNLRPGVNNGIPQNNVLTINAAGVLDLNNFDQSFRGLQGNGVVRNDTGAVKTLTLTTPGAADQFEFTGTIRNGAQPVALTKTGPGTQILSGTLGYTGNTAVNGGTLLVHGISTAASNHTIGTGATLGGLGIIGGSITGTANSILAPGGNTPATEAGQLRSGSLALASGATLALDLNGPVVGGGLGSSSSYDQLDVTGTIALTSGANLQLELNYVPVVGQKLFVLNNDGIDLITGAFTSLNGTPASLGEGAIFSLTSTADSQSYDFRISYQGEFYADNVNVGNDLVLVAVPEPTAVLSLLGGLGVLIAARRPRRLAK